MNSRKPDRSGGFHLIVLGTDPAAEPVGIRCSPPYLPEAVRQLVHRAKELAVGQGVAVAFLDYGEVAH